MGVTDVAKTPKKKPAAKKKAPVVRRSEASIIHLRGSDAFRAWFLDAVAYARIPASDLVRKSLADWAAREGFKAPPRL